MCRFGWKIAVYLDCSRSLFGSQVAKSIHAGKRTVRAAFRELASNNPSPYAVVGCRERRAWPVLRERAFRMLAQEAGTLTAFEIQNVPAKSKRTF